jgi:hypothetical protein
MTCGDTWEGLEEVEHEHTCGREVNHEGVCCCITCGRVRLERRTDAPRLVLTHDIPETHIHGHCSVENLEAIQEMNLQDCDFGYQVAHDGRVWVCINGVAFLRFKPDRSKRDTDAPTII